MLVGIIAAAILSAGLAVGILVTIGAGDAGDVTQTSERSAAPTPSATPRPPATPTSTPTSTPSSSDAVSPDPETAPAAPVAPAPPAPPPASEPGIIGMAPGPIEGCGEFPSGQPRNLSFSYTANKGNTVDIFYAYTSTDVPATGGFILLGSGLPSSGSVTIPRTCPTDASGFFPLITVKVVANSPLGSATAFFSGI